MTGSTLSVLIKAHIQPGQILLTPGRGNPARYQRPFTVSEVTDSWVVFSFPNSRILVQFAHIEKALREMRKAGGEAPIGAYQGWANEGTLEQFVQNARGNQQRTANYVAPILVECEVATYTTDKAAKGIRLNNPTLS